MWSDERELVVEAKHSISLHPFLRYDKEFKLNAVKLYLGSGRGCKKISEAWGVPTGTLGSVGSKIIKRKATRPFPGKAYQGPPTAKWPCDAKRYASSHHRENEIPVYAEHEAQFSVEKMLVPLSSGGSTLRHQKSLCFTKIEHYLSLNKYYQILNRGF